MHTRMLLLLPFGISMIILLGGRAAAQPSSTSNSGAAASPSGTPYSGVPVFADSWSGVTAGAAAGYCLAKHPYLSNSSAPYTTDGYEKVGSPGIVGAVRRNFVRKRTTTTTDTGLHQTCDMACREMGKDYEPKYQGRALHQDLGNGRIITSGIGDMAADAFPDYDFYVGRLTVSGMVSRGNTYHEDDVAQADYCCCHVTPPTRPTVTPAPTPTLRQ